MKTEIDNTIDVPDLLATDQRPTDVPHFMLERDSDPRPVHRKTHLWPWIIAVGAAIIVAIIIAIRYGQLYRGLDNKPCFSDRENIERLKNPVGKLVRGTTHTSDSILGVAMDFYSLDGLCASLEKELPDTTDASLVLFMRSADYHPDGSAIGSLVVDGESRTAKERRSRPAYVAIAPSGKLLIGVSLSDKLYDNAISTGGSFFRQYLLLNDGELPHSFQLHGKVERAAIGRMPDDSLFYVVTRHEETMYDFADALREYGFVDAVYITGGNNYRFSRDVGGKVEMEAATRAKIEKYTQSAPPVPFLVFRTACLSDK